MNVLLKLRRRKKMASQPDAWFISGDDTGAWIQEISTWKIPLSNILLHPIPRSLNDRTPCGVLAVFDEAATIHPSPQVLPYRSLVPGFFLPCDGYLEPPVEKEELEGLCSYRAHVFHPVAGLVGFDEPDILDVTQLLKAPEQRSAGWGSPHPGIPVPMSLKAVIRIITENTDELLEEGKSDIGQADVKELPPLTGEPSTILPAKSMRKLRLLASNLGLKFLNLFPRTAPSRTWVNDFEDWLQKERTGALGGMEHVRNKELHRLMDLLERDPDEGLKYALPLNSGDGRGTSQNNDNLLGQREIDYSFGGPGGSQATSNWVVDPEFYRKLRSAYLEAANHELSAGRYRRAAYVFSHLLGDHHAAAMALKKGGHYHEAAEVFQKKLASPRMAAGCLCDGGFLSEAAVLFEKLEDHEKVGDIHHQLGDPDAARDSYRLAVSYALRQDNLLAAAELQDQKLREPDQALESLDKGWPHHAQAELCLQKGFGIRSRLGRHDDSLLKVQNLVAQTEDPEHAVVLVRTLAELCRSYPDPDLRTSAADGARVVAGKSFPGSHMHQIDALATGLRSMEPDDPIFIRDTQRFAQSKSPYGRNDKLFKPASSDCIEITKRIKVLKNVQWTSGISNGVGIYACGFQPGRLIVLHGLWDSLLGHVEIDVPSVSGSLISGMECRVDLHLHNADETFLSILADIDGEFPEIGMVDVGTPWARSNTVSMGRPPWIPSDIICLSSGIGGHIWAVRFQKDVFILAEYSARGDMVNQYDLISVSDGNPDSNPSPLSCLVGDTGLSVVVTIGNILIWRTHQESGLVELPDMAWRLSTWSIRPKQLAAVSHSWGVTLYQFDHGGQRALSMDLENPLTYFLPNGMLVVVGNEGRVYDTLPGSPILAGRFRVGPGRPCAIVRGDQDDHFAILYDNGSILMYSVAGVL